MRCATTLLTVVLFGFCAATATAATASVQATGDGKVASRIWSVVYRADPGERNMVKVGTFAATLRLDDSGAIIRAGSGCVSIDDHAVRCTAPTQDVYLFAEAGDGGDYIYGSLKDDVIRGGPGDDFLDGGLGRDFVDGEEGNDVLRSRDGADRLFGGPGYDEIRLNRARPLGGPLDYARGGPYLCDGGIVIGARAYDEVRSCDRVSYGLAATSATPRVNATSARLTLTCPTPKAAGRGHCTGRIGVRGRRSGDAEFDIRAGHAATIVVRLRRGRTRSARYGFVISGTGRYLHRRYALRASWSVSVAYLKPSF